MESQPESFENLRRLLALKRHEQPPPGYFDELHQDVLLRLQAGEGAGTAGWESVGWQAPWLERMWESLFGKPVFTGAFGVAACAMVIAGVLYAERAELPGSEQSALVQPALSLPGAAPALVFNQPIAEPQLVGSTNSSIQPTIPSSLFGGTINPELARRPFGSLGGN